MRAFLAAAIAAIEAVAAALVTLLIAAAIAYGVWWFSFELAAEPVTVLAGAASAWLLAHFVPIALDIPAEAMLQLGFAPDSLKLTLSLAPLGLTLLSAAAGARSGWRFGSRGGTGAGGVIGGATGFGAVTGIVAFLVPLAVTPPWIAGLYGALIFGIPSLIAFLTRSARESPRWWNAAVAATEQMLARLQVPKPSLFLIRASAALRFTTMLLAGYIGIAALGLVISLVGRFAQITAASQTLQLDGWGALILWVVELLFLPVAVLWSGAWLSGAGFSVGAGTSASPFGVLLGPVPAVPLLNAIPEGWGSFAVFAPTLLVVLGIAIGVLFGKSAARRGAAELAVTAVVAALLFGLLVALANVLASGSIGPGRLSATGPEVWLGAGLAAAELGGGALIGALASRADVLRRVATLPDLGLTDMKLPEMKLRGLGGAVREERSVLRAEGPVAADQDPQDEADARSARSTEPGDEPGERLAPVARLVPRRAEDAELTEPLDDPRRPAANAADDDHATLPLDEGVGEGHEGGYDAGALTDPPREEAPAPRSRRAPTLFDQHGEGHEAAAGAPAAADSAAEHTGVTAQVELDPEVLAEAYSWDHIDEAVPAPAPTPQAGWRWPRRKR